MSTDHGLEFNLGPSKNSPDRMAIGMLVQAKPWLESAEALLKLDADGHPPGWRFQPPIYFLALQCLESSLKSFLYARGVSVKHLKRVYDHDLVKTLAKAEALGIERIVETTHITRYCVNMLNDEYKGKNLQYFQGSGSIEIPEPGHVVETAATYYRAIDRAYRAHRAQERRASKPDPDSAPPADACPNG